VKIPKGRTYCGVEQLVARKATIVIEMPLVVLIKFSGIRGFRTKEF